MDRDFYAFWLTFAIKVPVRKLWRCVEQLGSPEAIYKAKEQELKLLTELERRHIKQLKECKEIQALWEKREGKSYQFLPYNNAKFPRRLSVLNDCPFGVYYEGMALPEEEKQQPVVAIVGARNCTVYGAEFAYQIARELGRQGVAVVSGLASGIDGAGHRGSLDGGGYTLGILGAGIDVIYPKENHRLFMEMREKGGIMTEYPPGTKPLSMLFPRRNRIISALADFVLVVEAREKSGSLITTDFALEQGKDIGVVPGRPCDALSSGCNRLLQQGAKCILSAEDVLEELMDTAAIAKRKIQTPLVKSDLGLAPKEKMVYSCLRLEPQFIDEILCQLDIPVWEGIQILSELEIKGVIKQNPHHFYYRL